MMYRRTSRALLALCAAASVLSACGGGGSSAKPNIGGALPPSGSHGTNSAFSYDTSSVSSAQLIAPAQLKTLSVDVIPRMQNAGGLLAYARSVNDPRSGSYRHFLTPQEIGDRFGASATDYAAARSYFTSHGLRVATWPQRLLMHVSGAQSDLEAAFGTKFGWYKNAGGVFLAPMQAPVLPAGVPVTGSPNIVTAVTSFTNSVKIEGSQNDGLIYGYAPQQVAAAFDYTGAYRDGYTGAGINVGIIGTGGFSAKDVPAYKAMFHVPGSGTATMVSATDADAPGNTATGFATPPPLTGPCLGSSVSPQPWCNPEDGETQIDTEQIAGLAYDSNIRYYLAYNPHDNCGKVGVKCPKGAGIPLQGLGEIDAELQTAIADNGADTISISFGGPEAGLVGKPFNASGNGLDPLEYAALASEGIAVFVSSGDAGAEQCQAPFYAPQADSLCVSYPSTDPNVVSVGGTNSPIDSAGKLIGPLTGWGSTNTGGQGGSGGGVSAYFSQSPFQSGASGVTGTMRNTPDISLNADSKTGVATLMYGDPQFASQAVFPFGGTSVAAPEAAAMWALVLQACKQSASCSTATGAHPYRLGNPNAYFYKLYKDPSQYPVAFYDVLWGNNAQQSICQQFGPTPPPNPKATPGPCPTGLDPGYNAQTGYDLITGLGVPYARALIHAVVGV